MWNTFYREIPPLSGWPCYYITATDSPLTFHHHWPFTKSAFFVSRRPQETSHVMRGTFFRETLPSSGWQTRVCFILCHVDLRRRLRQCRHTLSWDPSAVGMTVLLYSTFIDHWPFAKSAFFCFFINNILSSSLDNATHQQHTGYLLLLLFSTILFGIAATVLR